MRKIVLFIAALLFMAVPVMAVSNVHINCSDNDVNEVTVSYVSDHNLIRAFGLDINVVGANITKVVAVDANYRIYPGQIVIVDGNVTDYNTPYAPGDLGDANVTIEMGSLYADNDPCFQDPPGLSGTLLKFYVDGACDYVVTENALRGGVVMEDPYEEPNVTLCSGSVVTAPVECMKATHPDYTNWSYWNKPKCWCYSRQCRGDADGLKLGLFWVSANDLNLLRLSIGKLEAQLPPGGICCDFDHKKLGLFWVSANDLNIIRLYIGKLEGAIPVCDSTHINFWCTPGTCP